MSITSSEAIEPQETRINSARRQTLEQYGQPVRPEGLLDKLRTYRPNHLSAFRPPLFTSVAIGFTGLLMLTASIYGRSGENNQTDNVQTGINIPPTPNLVQSGNRTECPDPVDIAALKAADPTAPIMVLLAKAGYPVQVWVPKGALELLEDARRVRLQLDRDIRDKKVDGKKTGEIYIDYHDLSTQVSMDGMYQRDFNGICRVVTEYSK